MNDEQHAETLESLALILTRQGETARFLSAQLVWLVQDRDLCKAIRDTLRVFDEVPSTDRLTTAYLEQVRAGMQQLGHLGQAEE